ncbi:MAG: beta-ketoacyl-ACP synthase II [Candidatus Auribacterota bacterium]|jgi:3-oxoacyl-[acyl-carrier-protein] synthase II|nr:beta-ketoacyl-ACP synthase II [Candidatus Auribacterota bacterium]
MRHINRRVVVTGMEMITPLGVGMEETWKAMQAGKSGVDYIKRFDCETFQTRIAGQVKNFKFSDFILDYPDIEDLGIHSKFSLAATKMALENSGIEVDKINPRRSGVYLGSGEGEFDFFGFTDCIIDSWCEDHVDLHDFFEAGRRHLHPFRELEHDSNRPAAHIASYFGFYGPNSNCLTACAASSQAIGEAWSMIRRGDADVMITGGAHSMIHPLGVLGFNLLTALSTQNDEPTKASKPFDIKRDGFVLGEGSAILILEDMEHAKARGARILGEIIGYGTSADSFRITDAHPEGRGAIDAMSRALRQAGIQPKDIDYINAHGTSTNVNDTVETIAIKSVFGDNMENIPVSSVKSMMGHLIAAAGAAELITCLLALRDGIIPPTINYNDPDPQCDLDYVPNKCRKKELNTILSNSFGFGGQNVALVVRKFGS